MPEMDGYETMPSDPRTWRNSGSLPGSSPLTAKAMKGDRENAIGRARRIMSRSPSTWTNCSRCCGCWISGRSGQPVRAWRSSLREGLSTRGVLRPGETTIASTSPDLGENGVILVVEDDLVLMRQILVDCGAYARPEGIGRHCAGSGGDRLWRGMNSARLLSLSIVRLPDMRRLEQSSTISSTIS